MEAGREAGVRRKHWLLFGRAGSSGQQGPRAWGRSPRHGVIHGAAASLAAASAAIGTRGCPAQRLRPAPARGYGLVSVPGCALPDSFSAKRKSLSVREGKTWKSFCWGAQGPTSGGSGLAAGRSPGSLDSHTLQAASSSDPHVAFTPLHLMPGREGRTISVTCSPVGDISWLWQNTRPIIFGGVTIMELIWCFIIALLGEQRGKRERPGVWFQTSSQCRALRASSGAGELGLPFPWPPPPLLASPSWDVLSECCSKRVEVSCQKQLCGRTKQEGGWKFAEMLQESVLQGKVHTSFSR